MSNNELLKATTAIVESLSKLQEDKDKLSAIEAAAIILKLNFSGSAKTHLHQKDEKKPADNSNTVDENISIKDYMLEKSPKTDVERVACLAYYLTKHRNTPFFKTKDLSALNTEGAQRKLSNPAVAVDNAARLGYFVQAPTGKGQKQLNAKAERYIELLPNTEEAEKFKPTPIKSKAKKKVTKKATKKVDK